MTYTINGKPYTESDINERCAEVMEHRTVNYCRSAHYTWPIIEKCWAVLFTVCEEENRYDDTVWEQLIDKHKCTKLIAACICLMELNE
jgi:hypothetical protein